MPDDKLSNPRSEADQLAALAGPFGEIVGVRSMCRGCGRGIMSPPIGGVQTFCCVTCWEGYPENYIKLTSDRILAEIALSAKRIPKEGTRARSRSLRSISCARRTGSSSTSHQTAACRGWS